MHRMRIGTGSKREVLDMTDRINEAVAQARMGQGLCHAFALHTTVALTVADLDPGTDLDLLDAFAAMVPRLEYRHPHDPSHVGDHILSALIGPGVTLPFADGRLVLGTWQRVVLVELDGPREREVALTLVAEAGPAGPER